MSKNLMIQGTMSGAGKSILTAGILRLLTQDGYRCAPFKSQNMALNSFVTADGREMGRAQVVQAVAARILPSADMNPILLKPMGDTTSQVIVNGRPVANMKAKDYFARKKELIPDILAAYRRLEEKADIIVIEGAGSPVEINLRENDIVNMGLAGMIDAPVFLVGNIDPGGVFAQLLGTVELMQPKERERVRGLIINKFRGDPSILMPGLDMFREYCDIPFAGLVPYVPLDLDEEDSISEKLRNSEETKNGKKPGEQEETRIRGKSGSRGNKQSVVDTSVRISVIRLPMISNYTDFTALSHIEGVSLCYIGEGHTEHSACSLEEADLIILPGSKNTIGDLEWLWESGLAENIRAAALGGTPVIGICGGYQMLGQSVADPECAEAGGWICGLGLLPIRTVFDSKKATRQSAGRTEDLPGIWAPLSGLPVSGYEIHMGKSEIDGSSDCLSESGSEADFSPAAFCRLCRSRAGKTEQAVGAYADGCVVGTVLGTYLHGLFDEPALRQALVQILFARKGLPVPETGTETAAQYQDRQLDLLADVLREHLDMKLLYDTIGL